MVLGFIKPSHITITHNLFQRAQTEAVTFLGNQESSRSLYAIPGLDYVAHDDIIPYTSVERVPLQHELFDKFLMHNPDKGERLDTMMHNSDQYLFIDFIVRFDSGKCVNITHFPLFTVYLTLHINF